MRMEDDLSFTISDFTPEIDDNNTSPASVVDRVLSRLRACHPDSRSRDELLCDRLIQGSSAAIRKALQRLEKKGLITSTVPEESQAKTYTAVLARGEGKKLSQPPKHPSAGTGSALGQQPVPPLSCPSLLDGAVEIEISEEELGQS